MVMFSHYCSKSPELANLPSGNLLMIAAIDWQAASTILLCVVLGSFSPDSVLVCVICIRAPKITPVEGIVFCVL